MPLTNIKIVYIDTNFHLYMPAAKTHHTPHSPMAYLNSGQAPSIRSKDPMLAQHGHPNTPNTVVAEHIYCVNQAMDMRYALRFLPQNTPEWEELTKGQRRLFEITASMAANVVGVGYDSPILQYNYDCGLKERPTTGLGVAYQAAGKEDEDIVVDQFICWWNENVQRPIAVYRTGTWEHPRYPWLAASPDRYLYDIEQESVYLLEAKSRQGDNNAQDCPDKHFIQCQLQLACVPEAKGLFYISSNVRSAYTDVPTIINAISRDERFVEVEIIPRLQNYRQLVATRTPPKKQYRKPHFLSYLAASIKRVYPDVNQQEIHPVPNTEQQPV